MKATRWLIALVVLLGAGIGSASADWGRHGRIGVWIGGPIGPWGYPPPYYYPPYYYPPVVVERVAPPVYVEQQAEPEVAQAAPPANNSWYYCAAAKAYYPYVKECPGGWQPVVPQPPAPN